MLMGAGVAAANIPEDFADIADVSKGIQVEMRYASDWNFTGRTVPGYEANRCLLTTAAAKALAKVQATVEKQGYSILVFDCYRPQKAVSSFVAWTKDRSDQKMKSLFYPDEPKEKLVARGYIDSLSGHSRGSTVDLTLVKNPKPGASFHEEKSDCRDPQNIEATGQLNMGTAYDCFSRLANTESADVPKAALANRRLLKAAMERAGFVNYPKEWWHYSLRNEPYKDRNFDFNIQSH